MKKIVCVLAMLLLVTTNCFGASVNLTEVDEDDIIVMDNITEQLEIDYNISVIDEAIANDTLNNYDVLGLNVDEHYYTIIIEDDVIQKIELNGIEDVKLNISASKEDILNFALNYNSMGFMDKLDYLMNNFNFDFDTLKLVMKLF